MQSKAATVDAYIAEAPPERCDALALLRRLCREELPGFEETMLYGMPSYMRGGEVEVAFASQKAYVSLYILRQAALAANRRAARRDLASARAASASAVPSRSIRRRCALCSPQRRPTPARSADQAARARRCLERRADGAAAPGATGGANRAAVRLDGGVGAGHHLAGRPHLRAAGRSAGEPLRREDRLLRPRARRHRAVGQVERAESLAEQQPHRVLDERHARRLRDERDGARRARVRLEHVQAPLVHGELQVEQAARTGALRDERAPRGGSRPRARA